MSRRWSAWLLLVTVALPFGLAAGLFVHSLVDHHADNDHFGQFGKALVHGHWHDLGVDDHDHVAFESPSPLDVRTLRATAGACAGVAVDVAVVVVAPVLATESPPPRPAGADLLHHLSLLRI